ncbi:MAG: transposase [Desulfobulbaceae bacterium]|nr:transposase [Desulfobulbaceae bacterium]
MARVARVVVPGYPHHVTQRGVRSLPVFFEDNDRIEYLRLLKKQTERFGVQILSYCLMTNHIHLIAVPESETCLAKAIGEAHRLYTRTINERLGVKGYLFQGRFFSCPLDENHLLSALRYVERNPVRAKMAKLPWDYRWSSARYHVGLTKNDGLVKPSKLFVEINDWYAFLLTEEEDLNQLREKTRTGRPLGNNSFYNAVEKLTGRDLRLKQKGRPKRK